MEMEFRTASRFSPDEIAALFSACFANYFVPLHVDAAAIGNMVRRDSVDLARSPVAVRDGQSVGFALLAQRGEHMRIAAMGVQPGVRRTGVARGMMDHCFDVARSSKCCEVVLEVITANEPAVRLYESMGFRRTNALWGFKTADAQTTQTVAMNAEPPIGDFSETEPDRVADWIAAHGAANLPWQLDAVTIRTSLPGCRAFEWSGRAACLVTNPDEKGIGLLSLVVHREMRRTGIGRTMVSELLRRFPGRTWRVPELVPEGPATNFLQALGWQASAIQQFQMCKSLSYQS